MVNAYRKLPGLLSSLRLVTSNTAEGVEIVPRPPVVNIPAPSAPGKAGCCACVYNGLIRKKLLTTIARHEYAVCVKRVKFGISNRFGQW